MSDNCEEILSQEQELIIVHKKEKKELQGIYFIKSVLCLIFFLCLKSIDY